MTNYHERQNLVLDEQTGDKIKSSKILVIGAGSGGNEVLKNLALMGFGNFTIVDFDPIEAHNLSRTTLFNKADVGKSKADVAATKLYEISLHANPQIVAINAKIQDVGKQVFLNNDIIVCCVDTNNARAYINDWAVRLQKPLFELGFEKFVVQVNFFPNEEPTDACLREIIGFGEFTGKRNSCSQLVIGDDDLRHIPTIQVSAALAGAFVASEIIMHLKGVSKLKNSMLQYSSEYQTFNIFTFPQSQKCAIHKDSNLSVIDSDLSIESSILHLLQHAKNTLGDECMLRLDDDFILTMECEECSKVIEINKNKLDLYDKERWCSECRENAYEFRAISKPWRFIREISMLNRKHAQYLNMELAEIGIKNSDLVRLNSLANLDNSYLLKIK